MFNTPPPTLHSQGLAWLKNTQSCFRLSKVEPAGWMDGVGGGGGVVQEAMDDSCLYPVKALVELPPSLTVVY